MIEKLINPAFASFIISLSVIYGQAQNAENCRGPIYTAKEVTRRAKITKPANFNVIYKAFGSDIHAHAVLDAVLCRSGHVTDIKVIEISPVKITEFIVAAVSEISFKPAEMNWHTVSQRQRFEFNINETGVKGIDPAIAAGRLVESLDVMGNRRFTAQEIRSWIKTRPGEPYNAEQIQTDLLAILSKGYFDKTGTRVFTEDGVRGGVGVYFEVQELPMIGVVSFEGLKINPALVRQAWKDAQVNLQTGEPFTPETGKAAIRVLKQVLDSKALNYSKVDLRAEMSTSQTVNLIFVITN